MRKITVIFHEDNDDGYVDNAIERIKNFSEVASVVEDNIEEQNFSLERNYL